MKYVVYYDRTPEGKLYNPCGTEWFLIPDQRLSVRSLVAKVKYKSIIRPNNAKAFTINEGYDVEHNSPVTNTYLL